MPRPRSRHQRSEKIDWGSRPVRGVSGSTYLEDVAEKTKVKKTLRPESLASLKGFASQLKDGACTRVAATYQDPRGNLMSVKSYGHMHHPIHGHNYSHDATGGAFDGAPSVPDTGVPDTGPETAYPGMNS